MEAILGRKILIVDDDKDNIDIMRILLKRNNYDVVTAIRGNEALEIARQTFFNVILMDIKMPGMSGVDVLEKLREESPLSQVMLITAYGTREHMGRAKKAGVYDIIEKPIDNDLLLMKIDKAFNHFYTLMKNEQLKKEVLEKYPYENIVGNSPKMKELFKIIETVAKSDMCITITGETGTGKELVARALHARSERWERPFVAVNASAFPETLLEAELFGHEKGAFTGADRKKIGYFESSEGGTIFLDEIGEVSPKIQVSLLRVLQERKIYRLGSTTPIKINVRLLTATNQKLEKLIEEKKFRSDFYYRISTDSIHLPPLRERKSDIPLLVEHFIDKYAETQKGKNTKIAEDALELLTNFDFPGNIRQLEGFIQRAMAYKKGDVIKLTDLPPDMNGKGNVSVFSELYQLPWNEARLRFEKMYIEALLEQSNGNVTQAAKVAKRDRAGLQRRVKELEIQR